MGKNKKLIYFLGIVCLVLVVSSLIVVFSVKKPLKVEELDIFFSVVEKESTGFDVNNSALFFGRTFPGGNKIIRFVDVKNDYSFPIEARFLVSNNILPAISVEPSYFIQQNSNVSVPVSFYAPEDFELGDYEGKLRIEMYKAD